VTTFIVRILAAAGDEYRGTVCHVRTGREETFRSWRQLRDFLDRMTADAEPDGVERSPSPADPSPSPPLSPRR